MTSGATLGRDEYLEAVRSTLPAIRERARETEELGRLPEATVRDLDEVGVFRGLQPRQWGGLELDPVTFFESVVLIGSACGSTGWVAGVLGVHPWEMALLSDQAQMDVWGKNPLTRASSSYANTGHVKRVEDGFVLSGTWRFSSGVDLADWAILGGTPEGEEPSESAAYLVSGEDFVVDGDSWEVAGLKGTGSKTVNLNGAFVPTYRSHRMVDVMKGVNPGLEVNDRPLYRLPWMNGIFTWAIAAPAIGAATGALEAYTEQTRTRVAAMGGRAVAESPAVHARLSSALSEVDAVRFQMMSTMEEFYGLACKGERIPLEAQLRSRYEGARAISKCLYAVLDVFEVAGGGVMHLSNPIQRYLRDVLAMNNHPMGALEGTATPWARELLGLSSPPPRG